MLHGFWLGCGTGTAALKAKLIQQLMAMREAFLFKVFLDLQKTYDALDCERCLEILASYGVGSRTLRILWKCWYYLTMVTWAGRYF